MQAEGGGEGERVGVTVQFSARNDLSMMILLTWSINDNCNVQTSDVLQYVCAVGL